jgi:hypothetical protein
VKLVCCGRWDVYGEEKVLGLCPEKEEKISGEELASRIFRWDRMDSAAWDKFYHASLLQEIRYPMGVICEDVPVTYRIALKAGEAVLCPKPFINYYHRPGSITTAALSDKNFHFSQHTAEIYPYIRKNYPEIADAARYQRVRSLTQIMLLLDTSDSETRKKYASRYRALRRELSVHTGFFLHCRWLSAKEKVTNLLLVLGVYRMLRPIFHKGSH